ncbi:double-stranded RNA-specific editase B2-like [Thalassophryne amazonica]|uniref:double-stranded RNA-specific editase B2-like n=1 Tax=Thalassophryne amazonica TaxID=390379 RepID=UPI001470D1EB|nr:double-stranded RNA-specific editase B2-like [Thalassophryne amazonica]
MVWSEVSISFPTFTISISIQAGAGKLPVAGIKTQMLALPHLGHILQAAQPPAAELHDEAFLSWKTKRRGMAAVQEDCSRNLERADDNMNIQSRRRSRRRRRWRCKAKGTNGYKVTENQDDHPAAFSTTLPRCRTRALTRKRVLFGRKERLLFQNRLSCKRAAWAVTQKNALVQLNELKPGLRYEMTSKTGPLHAPVFSVSVEVNGLHFEGQGLTKKQAKMRAAELALRSFIQFPNALQAHAIMTNINNTPMDFTVDNVDVHDSLLKECKPLACENCDVLYYTEEKQEVFSSLYNHRRLIRLSLDLVSSANPKQPTLSAPLLERLSPVALLDKLRPGLRYFCLTERVQGQPIKRFIMVVRVDGRVFEGCGHSKPLAKAQAAAVALQSLYNIRLGPESKTRDLQGRRTKNQLPQFFAESIFHLVKEKYKELTDSFLSTSHAHHKVLAGIVMTTGFDLGSAQVVSLATGTKSHYRKNATYQCGLTLGDCHAEVITRRALVRFLYSQLELLLFKPEDGEQRSIFVPNKGGGFRLRDGVLFHMYVSSSPCGDARLNCPYENTAAYPSRSFRSHLRTKIHGGEGTLPVSAWTTNQKWEGVLPHKPLASMSCTDKMAKWNVVGLQGALLSHMVEPVYLHSLTVGTLAHTGHLARALTRRLAPVQHLLVPYRRQQLLLGCLSSCKVRMVGKTSGLSVNWSCGDGGLEEIISSTGWSDSGMPSRLCRRSLFTRWQKLQQQVSGQISEPKAASSAYSESKMAAGHYQTALQQFYVALQNVGLGPWLRKPPELSHFHTGV